MDGFFITVIIFSFIMGAVHLLMYLHASSESAKFTSIVNFALFGIFVLVMYLNNTYVSNQPPTVKVDTVVEYDATEEKLRLNLGEELSTKGVAMGNLEKGDAIEVTYYDFLGISDILVKYVKVED